VRTEQVHGTVLYVEGSDIAVRLADGKLREFKVPPSRKFIIDGKETKASEVQPGTELIATVTTKSTPVTQRTTTVGSAKVWFVNGNSVILTLPNGENHTYQVNDSYRFTVDGRPASVHDLRKGMDVSAQKIVEEPMTEVESDIVVTGRAPKKG